MITGLLLLGSAAMPVAAKALAIAAATAIAVPIAGAIWVMGAVLTTPKRWR